MTLEIGGRYIGDGHPTYFIADIAANHDGSLDRAKHLIRLAHQAGADAAKFQHFKAHSIVSSLGFASLEGNQSHQAKWERDVVEVYDDAAVPDDWTRELHAECESVGITFLSTPYNAAAVNMLDPLVPAFKIGSGDIDWHEHLEHIARKGKPVILAIGAADFAEVERAVEVVQQWNAEIAILQCTTNYTGADENLDFVNLRVLTTLRERWPHLVLGLSDHTKAPEPVIGAVALGARIIERHFTDDTSRPGPDHGFAMDPDTWADMIARTRIVERALGSCTKEIADNEVDSVVVQRRALRFARSLPPGHVLTRDDIDVLRPAAAGAITPPHLLDVIGRETLRRVNADEHISWSDLTA
jgi:N-acetylneuraminate synthase